jgi:hypothetical protein
MNPAESARRNREFVAQHPQPDGTPEGSLRHLLDIYADAEDSALAMTATRGMYGPDVVTGIRFGDLRAIAQRLPEPAATDKAEVWGYRMSSSVNIVYPFSESEAMSRAQNYAAASKDEVCVYSGSGKPGEWARRATATPDGTVTKSAAS